MYKELLTYTRHFMYTRICLVAVAVLYSAALLAQPATPPTKPTSRITIGGNVYGGGNKAGINTGNAVLTNGETDLKGALEKLSVTDENCLAAEVKVYEGIIEGSVFGGGAVGRSFGQTSVMLSGVKVWVSDRVFGAGDGTGAGVFGGSLVTMENGTVANAIYGGGNEARTIGNTTVHIIGGSAIRSLYGGSRAANVYGRTFVWLDGENAHNDIMVGSMYGGNDVTGVIYPVPTDVPTEGAPGYDPNLTAANLALMNANWGWAKKENIHKPAEMVVLTADDLKGITSAGNITSINDDWNAFVYTSRDATDSKKIEVRNLFVGGNGDYDYDSDLLPNPKYVQGGTEPEQIANPYKGRPRPELARGYVQFMGGTCDNLYGGGNNATVTVSTDICLLNKTEVSMYGRQYQFGRVFGGNNKAEMKIRPNWYLKEGRIENLYSGGNAGSMTYYVETKYVEKEENNETKIEREGDGGIFLAIESDDMHVHNVYGGCRMADVNPGNLGRGVTKLNSETQFGYTFQRDYATRVLISAGDVDNVYGGNDVSGIVYHGSQVEIHSTVHNDVYGGGNGSYHYTDKGAEYAAENGLTDYLFDPVKVLRARDKAYADLADDAILEDWEKVRALNLWRPDARKTYVHLKGQEGVESGEDGVGLDNTIDREAKVKMTYVGGSVYLGGNSATISTLDGKLADVSAHLQIGNYVVARNLFLGSNGENMVTKQTLQAFRDNCTFNLASTEKHDCTYEFGGYSTTVEMTPFDRYLRGVEVAILPTVAFDGESSEAMTNVTQDNDYREFRSAIGSLFLGGNVGSMTADDQFDFLFKQKIYIYKKLVAGCNNANVHVVEDDNGVALNTFHLGGLVMPTADNSPKLHLELSNIRLNPYRLRTGVDTETGKPTYTLEKNYWWRSLQDADATLSDDDAMDKVDLYGPGSRNIKKDGNIYGGCYTSGYVNGDVKIDITANTLYHDDIYNADNYNPESALNVLSSRLSVYGGGYGEDTEIWGDVEINVTNKGQILKVFGGGELGVVGKIQRHPETGKYMLSSTYDMDGSPRYVVDQPGSTKVTLSGTALQRDPGESDFAYDALRVYGGGYEGLVTGNTKVVLDGANVHSVFAGACNADIYGYTQLIVGEKSGEYPVVTNNLYGGNDFGGQIYGWQAKDIDNSGLDYLIEDRSTIDNTATGERLYPETKAPGKVYTQTYVEYHKGKVTGNIFGGSCGAYKYALAYTDIFNVQVDNNTGSVDVEYKEQGKHPSAFSLPNMLLDPYEHCHDEDGNTITIDRAKELGVNSFVNVVTSAVEAPDARIDGRNIRTMRYKTNDAGDYVDNDGNKVTDMTRRVIVEDDGHVGGIFGGGQGRVGRIKFADQKGSYVRLASYSESAQSLAPRVFGAGYCSNTDNALVDAFSGKYDKLFGGCYGMTFEERLRASEEAVEHSSDQELGSDQVGAIRVAFLSALYGGATSKVRLHNMLNPAMDIYGGGANAGSHESIVELYSGQARDVYGATLYEGYTCASVVVVPEGSDTKVHSIFGGAKAKSHKYICDVSNACVAYHSDRAIVSDNIYGGNNDDRFARSTYVFVDKPVYRYRDDKDPDKNVLADVFGGGKGKKTAVTFTNVALEDGAQVANVYGGGYDGRVMNSPTLRAYCMDEGDKIPYYDVKEDVWKIYTGKSRYFSDEVYEIAREASNYVINVPTTELNYSPRTYIAKASDYGTKDADVVAEHTVDGVLYYEVMSPVWGRFLKAITEGKVEDKTLTADNLWEKLGVQSATNFYNLWPGYSKYKYSPQTKAYHDWTLEQQAIWGQYNEQVFQPERGEPGEDGYQPERFEEYPYPAYRPKGFAQTVPLYELGQTTFLQNNCKVRLYKGSVVTGNVFGGGLGENAEASDDTDEYLLPGVVSGNTDVRLLGGVVKGNIYGGGSKGDVCTLPSVRVYTGEIITPHTSVMLGAGAVTNTYGGGFQGDVYGFAETTVGFEDKGKNVYDGNWDEAYYSYKDTKTKTTIGAYAASADRSKYIFTPRTLKSGDPCVERSLYGGGENGMVDCMANVMINQGHIGYKYDDTSIKGVATPTDEQLAKCYIENVQVDNSDTQNLLAENGNVFGGGYGDGAITYYTTVWMYGGTVRNSLYGGGEIASIGYPSSHLTMDLPTTEQATQQLAADVGRDIRDKNAKPGYAHVVMMDGTVRGNVFGGGRGYSYDERGNSISGKRFFSDGYVFGKTHVSVRGGTIGTDETLAKGEGNVFGGGNIGYVYTAAVKCVPAEGQEGYDANSPYNEDQGLLLHRDDKGHPLRYIPDRYYTNVWQCEKCNLITYCYMKPHACWHCQRHNSPASYEDYTDFKLVNSTITGETDNDILVLSEDTRVVVTPYMKVKNGQSITFARLAEDAMTDENGDPVTTITYKGRDNDHPGDYVPPRYLNTLKNKDADSDKWNKLNDNGVVIRNAVFAGGNVASGSDKVYANATTVFGNATASLNDIFFRDMISLGDDNIGGLYGDGNLTFVDGYRELNVTNYGTDFYNMGADIDYATYQGMTEREKAYFEVQYKCTASYTSGENTYTAGQIIGSDAYGKMTKADKAHWTEDVCKIFDGRLLNTIQRADFCGVFGSRIVLKGAEDRVISEVDYKMYTINRLGELSLNRAVYPGYDLTGRDLSFLWAESNDPDEKKDNEDKTKEYNMNVHGNYFGLYSVVNYLGGLTSDVSFGDKRLADANHKGDAASYGTKTYYQWKEDHRDSRYRNNGRSMNQVALASGVALELVKEPANGSLAQLQSDVTSTENKDCGYITGVVELDLINVAPGEGGGYVYAKNEHRTRPSVFEQYHTNLSTYNAGAVSNQDAILQYTNGTAQSIQTSGNFIHPTKRIIDNCYPMVNSYQGDQAAPAHYWFIKGDYYVYDQVLSAYTGSATAYSASIDLPLTIALGSRGKLDLINIQPNMYAYYAMDGSKLKEGETLLVGNKNYKLNDVITYWDYSLLTSQAEQACFVPKTMVATRSFKYTDGGTDVEVPVGTVYLDSWMEGKADVAAYETYDDGTVSTEKKTIGYFVRSSNEVGHGAGYALSVAFNNPMVWDNYYTPEKFTKIDDEFQAEKLNTDERNNSSIKSDLRMGPTYSPRTAHDSHVYGQREYKVGDVLALSKQTSYNEMMSYIADKNVPTPTHQAAFTECYVSTQSVSYEYNGATRTLNVGVGISKAEYESLNGKEEQASFSKAYICNVTYPKPTTANDYYYPDNLVPESEFALMQSEFVADYKKANTSADDATARQAFANYFETALICTTEGDYGGRFYEYGRNYGALESWSTIAGSERNNNFAYNFDALDVLALSDYTGHDGDQYGMYPGFITAGNSIEGKMGLYNGDWADYYPDDVSKWNIYNRSQKIDYKARWDGTDKNTAGETMTYYLNDGTQKTVTEGVELDRDEYESMPNEMQYYTQIAVTPGATMRIVKEQFAQGQIIYIVGEVMGDAVYNQLPSHLRAKVGTYNIPATMTDGTYYYCREAYTPGEAGYQTSANKFDITDLLTSNTYSYKTGGNAGDEVPVGTIISKAAHDKLVNTQTNFSIAGSSPMETSTLYVTREAEIENLSSERVITLIYRYSYQESDETGKNIEEIVERHIINIHLQFRSGEPQVGRLDPPGIVLPNTSVGLKLPNVVPGAYEVIGGGWEIYTNRDDAIKHHNGSEYNNNFEPVYWYQNDYHVAYYAKTYLGKTYSNSVPIRVANYHDLNEVLNHPQYMYVDHPDVDHKSKIYLDDRICYEPDGVTEKTAANGNSLSELDLLAEIFKVSLEGNKKTVETTQKTDANGSLLYYQLDDDGNKTTVEGTTPTPYPVMLTDEVSVFDKHARNCNNLEFFFNSDVELRNPEDFVPIGDEVNGCFSGVVHGMGHTASGLPRSLFGSLCGNVYNLGVTGTFNTAGIADASAAKSSFGCDAHDADKGADPAEDVTIVANCWTYTTSDEAKAKQPVFNYTDPTPEGKYHIVNCYYQDEAHFGDGKSYKGLDMDAEAIPSSAEQFRNGEVAYNLNGFYLVKRYANHATAENQWTSANANQHTYLIYDEATKSYKPHDGYYKIDDVKYPSYLFGTNSTARYLYAERQWIDGDLIYRYGKIPTTEDVRVKGNGVYYYPIWPDDYIFFGQHLTYGYDGTDTYTGLPTSTVKEDNNLVDHKTPNVVHRAPGYYRNSTLSQVYFNDDAWFVDHINGEDNDYVHHNLTAIDFTGQDDGGYSLFDKTSGYFFGPVLDMHSLEAFNVSGLTQNLMIYTPDDGDNGTKGAVAKKIFEPALVEQDDDYRTVAKAETGGVIGHQVVATATGFTTLSDHLLVDNQDYCAPFAYQMGGNATTGFRTWYQRDPENYVDDKKGWIAVSLPFESELVTTQDKGEITHFYGGSTKGHEYWLRELSAVGAPDNGVATATMNYPAATGGNTKEYTNTFLYDYYYYDEAVDLGQDDKNQDIYQTQYYSGAHDYEDYSYAQGNVPYIVGLPGVRYYEFDLSGQFVPENTYDKDIAKLNPQTVTFASHRAAAINATEALPVTKNGYSFVPNYLNLDVPAATAADKYYLLNQEGSAFVLAQDENVSADADKLKGLKVGAFRPYFKAEGSGKLQAPTRSIVFGMESDTQFGSDEQEGDGNTVHGLRVSTKKGRIYVESEMERDCQVRIYDAAGRLYDSYVICPGERVETRVPQGIYLVNKNKVLVK